MRLFVSTPFFASVPRIIGYEKSAIRSIVQRTPLRLRANRSADRARIAAPPAAVSAIYAFRRARCSVLLERARHSISTRASEVKKIGVASESCTASPCITTR